MFQKAQEDVFVYWDRKGTLSPEAISKRNHAQEIPHRAEKQFLNKYPEGEDDAVKYYDI